MPDSAQQILDILSRSKRVLVTTHVRPDGDALGTAAATVLGLRQKRDRRRSAAAQPPADEIRVHLQREGDRVHGCRVRLAGGFSA